MENIEVSRKAIVVGVNTGDNTLFNYQLSEIHNLCEGLNIEVLSDLVQNLVSINNATYIGKGKLEELNMAVSELHADMIIFNDELSPAQLKNITDYVDVEVMDRTMLILKIFEIRAKTKEAALQVEIAYYLDLRGHIQICLESVAVPAVEWELDVVVVKLN